MIEKIKAIDTSVFLYLNGKHNGFFDPIMYWLSNQWIWVPMYALIAFLIIREYKVKGISILVFACIVVALCDQTASHLIKNSVQRLRPSHEPTLAGIIHLSDAGPGGLYGFVSSHAANVFGLATFLFCVLSDSFKALKYWLFLWAALVSYSRIYNGVHYPFDVIVAIVIGMTYGWFIAKLYFFVIKYQLSKTS